MDFNILFKILLKSAIKNVTIFNIIEYYIKAFKKNKKVKK